MIKINTIEDKLKKIILNKHKSIRAFALNLGIPYTTINTIFQRGLMNSNINNILKICQSLEISADKLAYNKITYVKDIKHSHFSELEDFYNNIIDNLTLEERHDFTTEIKEYMKMKKKLFDQKMLISIHKPLQRITK